MTDIIDKDIFKKACVGLVTTKKKWRYERPDPDVYISAYIEFRDSPERLEEISNMLLTLGIGSSLAKNGSILKVQGLKNCIILAPYTDVQWFKEVMELCKQDMHKTREGLRHIFLIYPKDSKTRKKSNSTDISRVMK